MNLRDHINYIRKTQQPELGVDGQWWEWSVTIGEDTITGLKMCGSSEEVALSIEPYIAEKTGVRDRGGVISDALELDRLLGDEGPFLYGEEDLSGFKERK